MKAMFIFGYYLIFSSTPVQQVLSSARLLPTLFFDIRFFVAIVVGEFEEHR